MQQSTEVQLQYLFLIKHDTPADKDPGNQIKSRLSINGIYEICPDGLITAQNAKQVALLAKRLLCTLKHYNENWPQARNEYDRHIFFNLIRLERCLIPIINICHTYTGQPTLPLDRHNEEFPDYRPQ